MDTQQATPAIPATFRNGGLWFVADPDQPTQVAADVASNLFRSGRDYRVLRLPALLGFGPVLIAVVVAAGHRWWLAVGLAAILWTGLWVRYLWTKGEVGAPSVRSRYRYLTPTQGRGLDSVPFGSAEHRAAWEAGTDDFTRG